MRFRRGRRSFGRRGGRGRVRRVRARFTGVRRRGLRIGHRM